MPSSCYEFGNLQGAELISRIVSVAVDRVGQSRLDHQRVCDVVYCFEFSFDGKLFVEEVGGGHIAENFLIFDIGVQRELQTAKGYSGAAAARNGGIGAREFRGEILGDEAVFGSG